MSMDGGFRIKYPAGYALKNGKLPVGVRHHNQYLMDKKAIAAEEYSHLPKKEAYKMAAARIRAQRAKPASPWNILVSKEIKRLQPLRDEVGHKEIFAEAVENAKVEYHKGKVPHKIQKPNMALLPRFKVPHKIQKPNMALLPRLKKNNGIIGINAPEPQIVIPPFPQERNPYEEIPNLGLYEKHRYPLQKLGAEKQQINKNIVSYGPGIPSEGEVRKLYASKPKLPTYRLRRAAELAAIRRA